MHVGDLAHVDGPLLALLLALPVGPEAGGGGRRPLELLGGQGGAQAGPRHGALELHHVMGELHLVELGGEGKGEGGGRERGVGSEWAGLYMAVRFRGEGEGEGGRRGKSGGTSQAGTHSAAARLWNQWSGYS